jgi:hypothetical protein
MGKFLQSAALSVALIAGSVGAASAAAVDTLLSLVIDVSGSVNATEFNLQRQGYVNAFNDPGIQSLILDTDFGNRNGAIAVNVIQFSTGTSVSIPFTVLDSAADISAFATAISGITQFQSDLTSIGSGINTAVSTINTWLGTAGNSADAVVIDVSGDGTNNNGPEPAGARNAALAGPVDRINGIAIGNASLLAYYQNNVIGGAQSFALQASTFADFEDAIRDKLEFEITGTTPVPLPAPAFLLIAGLGGLVALRKSKKA